MYFDNDPDMSLYLYTLSWFRANQALLLLNASGFISREAINTNLMVFGLTQLLLEPTISHTWGHHANHYNNDEGGIPKENDLHVPAVIHRKTLSQKVVE